MIRILVSGLVTLLSACMACAALVYSLINGWDTDLGIVGAANATLFVLGVWSIRGSNAGVNCLAVALASGAIALFAAGSREGSVGVEAVATSGGEASHWRVPAVLLVMAGALLADRWLVRRHAGRAAEQGDEPASGL
jgi:hypothetical protein